MPRGVGISQSVPRSHHPKNHNKNNTTKNSSNSNTIKIKIRPFVKPPQLPDHYYEETSQLILQGTLNALKQQQQQQQSKQQQPQAQPNWSLQNAYQACVHLVRHHYGPRLYQDLILTLQEAAELVLPSSTTTFSISSSSSSNNHSSSSLWLTYICQQYHTYTDFLLLLKHICLPLDSTIVPNQQQQHSATATTTVAAATNIITSATTTTTSLWSTGLRVFLERLQVLEWDVELYRQWLTQFLQDWDQYRSTNTTTNTGSSGSGSLEQRQILQSVWYLFQDLQILSRLPLQHDLEEHWAHVSRQWQQQQHGSNNYPLREFLQWCTDKHDAAVTLWRPWLHPTWLIRILQQQLVQPHLNSEYLLREEYLFPVILEEWHHSSSNNNNNSHHNYSPTTTTTTIALTPVQQLWLLAGRLPGGTASVAGVLKQFCRQQGLQCVRMATTPQPPSAAAPTNPAKIAPPPPPNSNNNNVNNSNNAVPELLELQQRVATLQQQLLQVSHHSDSGGGSIGTTTSSSLHPQQSSPQPQHQQAPIPLKSVWEEVVNVDVTPCLAEQLAKFLDSILRSTKKMDQYSARNEDWLSRILNGIFIPLQAKDVFEAFYKRDLAKRLLWNRVVSMDVEKQVCSLLKAECGAGYTAKMEGMFQDVDWSRETMLVYKQSLQAGTPVGAMVSGVNADATNSRNPAASTVDVEVQVLTTGYWPVYPQYPNLHLPDNLKIPQEHFANHYKTKYQGRRMTWQYALGHCVVKAHGFAKPYELIVSLCQALVLIQFRNNSEPLTLPQLKLSTGLEDRDELERILQSLALGKDGTRILRKLDHDRGGGTGVKKTRPNVDDRDQFIVNTQFSSNARRIRIQNVLIKETREERTKTVESVARDRLYLIDAVLVRIMKARKTILHQALIPQVMEQIKVPAQPADIKKRIESLIEREYLERDAKDRNRYNYLA